jgi:hypothetical protein
MRKASHSLLWFAPPIVVVAAFLASLPWLADLDETVTLSITAATSIFVVVWGRLVATRMERALDEVQLAGQRFAQAKGAAGGTLVFGMVLLIVMQALGTVVANAIWNRRIGGNE